MIDDALCHLRGIRHLTLSGRVCDHDVVGVATAAASISDAGFAHLHGIQERKLSATHLSITGTAFSHLRGITSLDLRRGLCIQQGGDDTLALLPGIESLILNSAPNLTDAGLLHLPGFKTRCIPHCPALTCVGFEYLVGIRKLDMCTCTRVTDSTFQYLRGIHTLDISCCELLSEAAFVHFVDINTLVMRVFKQETILDNGFMHLAGIALSISAASIRRPLLPHISTTCQASKTCTWRFHMKLILSRSPGCGL